MHSSLVSPLVTEICLLNGRCVDVIRHHYLVVNDLQTFWDATGSLWQAGKLAGKFVGLFVSTATLGGGQESTALALISTFTHHGLIYVPLVTIIISCWLPTSLLFMEVSFSQHGFSQRHL